MIESPNQYPSGQQEATTSEYSQGFQSSNDSDTLIRWQLMYEDLNSEIEHRLKGEFLDGEGRWKERPYARKMNNVGVASIMQLLNTHLNKATPLTTYTQEEIHRKIYGMIETLIDLLEMSYNEFDIKKKDLSSVVTMVRDYAWTNLNRAKDGLTLKFLKHTERHTETVSQMPQEKKGGIFNFLNPFK